MPSAYPADFTVPSVRGPNARLAIVSSTDSTPISLTVTAHGISQGGSIEVEGHALNSNANGMHTVNVVDANTVQLTGTAGNGFGAGGATGYVVDYSILPVPDIIDDGTDDLDAGNINPGIEDSQNKATFLYRQTGRYRLYDVYTISHAVSLASSFGPGVAGYTVSPLGPLMSFGTPRPVCRNGDLLIADLDTCIVALGNTGLEQLQYQLRFDYASSFEPSGPTYQFTADAPISGGGATVPCRVHRFRNSKFVNLLGAGIDPGIIQGPGSLAQATFNFQLYRQTLASVAISEEYAGDVTFTIHHYRPNT